MHEISRILESADGRWLLASLLRGSIQGGTALAIAWLLCRALPKLPPAWKCWLLRLAYLKLLVALCWPTPIDLPVLRPEPRVESVAPLETSVSDHSAPAVPATSGGSGASRTRLDQVFLAVWTAGTGISVVVVAVRWRGAVRFRRCSSELADASLLRGYNQVATTSGVRRPPPLLTCDLAAGPLLVGLIRPAIVLPARLLGSDAARLRLMLAHELAHYRRHDLPWGMLPMIARILFWFHPVVWLAEREWWLARESACDALAVRATGASPAEYGGVLLDAASSSVSPAAGRFAAAGVIESKATLKRRLSAMQYLSFPSRRRWTLMGCGLVLAWASALVPVRLTAQPATRPATVTSHSQDAAGTVTSSATESAWPGALSLPGTVEARTAEIRPALDGVVSAVKCEIGQAVKQGDLLFHLDDRVARAQLVAAEAQLQLAKANVQEANARAGTGAVSPGAQREAQSRLEAAAADIEVRQVALLQTQIVAPFGGVVSRRDANVGEVVNRGAPLATLIQLDPLDVSVSVPQSDYLQLRVGQDARLYDGALRKRLATGRVSFISPQLDPATGTGAVKVAVGNADGRLKPGMFVNVEIRVAQANTRPAN